MSIAIFIILPILTFSHLLGKMISVLQLFWGKGCLTLAIQASFSSLVISYICGPYISCLTFKFTGFNNVSDMAPCYKRSVLRLGWFGMRVFIQICFSYFLVDPAGKVLTNQEGVFRSNCMDCLDRTNVIQSLLARRSLQAQLQVQILFFCY